MEYDFLNKIGVFDFTKKDRCVRHYITMMLNRCQSMFKWEGLPDTVPARSVELMLQVRGYCGFAEYAGELYAFFGGLGGEPDVYYMPTIFTIANPALNWSANLKINEECVIMPNDSLYAGLVPMFTRYATQMTETDLSIKIATVNSRIINLISAGDDRTKASAEKYLADVEKGKTGIIAENSFLDGIHSQPYGSSGNTNQLTNLIELMQYQKASWFNEIGLNANYNMKRESLNSEESQLNNDALLPLVDDMLRCRQTAVNKINDMFGTSIRVGLSSSWEDNAQEIELEHEEMGTDDEQEVTENENIE